MLLEGLERAKVTRFISQSSLARRVIAATPSPSLSARRRSRRPPNFTPGSQHPGSVRGLCRLQRRIPGEVVTMIQDAEGIDRPAYGMAAHLAVRPETRQKARGRAARNAVGLIGEVISGENDCCVSSARSRIRPRITLSKPARVLPPEQLKAIHRELGTDVTISSGDRQRWSTRRACRSR